MLGMMKRNDDFLRDFQKTPPRAFSDGLFKKLSDQKSFGDWFKPGIAWGVMVAMVVAGISSNLLAFNHSGLGATPTAEHARVEVVRQIINRASVGERGLMPRDFSPPAGEDDWLGPFDRPRPASEFDQVVVMKEVVAVIVPAVYR
jgi:hypothetical protein